MLRTVLRLGVAMIVVCVSTLHSQGATITAASTAQKDVAVAVASAQDGDTVQIPAGDSKWTSVLTISKAVTLQGQGIDKTFLRNHAGLFTLQPSKDLPIRITGIYFDMGPSFDRSVPNRSGVRLFGTLTSLRIDHCYFNCGERSVSIEGDIYGVTDHCTFKESNIAIYFTGANGGANSWNKPIHPGSIEAMYIEDCTFICTQPSKVVVDSELYGQNGGRGVMRYNTVDYTGTGVECDPFDAHGFYDGSGAWGDGTRFYEIYNNTIKFQYAWGAIFSLRGGTHIVWNNTMTMSNTGSMLAIWLQREKSGTDIPPAQLIKNSFFWNNTLSIGGGAPVTVGAGDSGQTTNEPVGNVDFFNRPIRSGDPWDPYTPLVYPHPLVTAQDGGKSSPIANLRVIGSGS
jgi:hypothetical protein